METGSCPQCTTWHEKEIVPRLLLQFGSYCTVPGFWATFTAIKDLFFKIYWLNWKTESHFWPLNCLSIWFWGKLRKPGNFFEANWEKKCFRQHSCTKFWICSPHNFQPKQLLPSELPDCLYTSHLILINNSPNPYVTVFSVFWHPYYIQSPLLKCPLAFKEVATMGLYGHYFSPASLQRQPHSSTLLT